MEEEGAGGSIQDDEIDIPPGEESGKVPLVAYLNYQPEGKKRRGLNHKRMFF